MNVLIAKTVEECRQWTEVAVVVDVLREATTLCALLEHGKKEVLVFESAQEAVSFVQEHSDFEIYSELDLPIAHEDNSPYLASKSNARKPVVLVTATGTKALLCARQASLVLAGGFCNFYTLAECLAAQQKDVLLIPSALFGTSDDVEDGLCVSALKDYIQGIGNPQEAIVEFNNTMRYGEFMKQFPKTASKDSKLAFKVNGLPVVPQISFSKEGYGVCHLYGAPAPAQWLGGSAAAAAEAPVSENRPAEVPVKEPNAEENSPSKEDLRAEADAGKESLTEAKQQATKRIKSFFNNILQAVKEEKEELEKELASSKKEPMEPAKTMAPVSDDLLDKVLKKSETVAEKKAEEKPAVPAADAAQPQPAAVPFAKEKVVAAGEVTFSGKDSGFQEKKHKKAIVLFSGGLDSTTCLYWALAHGYDCEALTVSYGQRHDREVLAAQMIARNLGVKHHLITLNLPWLSCCSLVDKKQELPDVPVEDIPKEGIPSTYVPGRNLMFLSLAGSLLDAVGAEAIVAGPNAIDFSGYPDCTPAFFKAAADALNRGTKTGVSEGIEVLAPLMRLSKAQIVALAAKLKVPFELTWSCYAGGKKPCGHCDSCKLRAKGFKEAGVHDTALD